MADEIDENDESALALDIIDGRKCLNTKNQYRLKVEHFRKWLEAKHPDCLRLDKTIELTKVDKVLRSVQHCVTSAASGASACRLELGFSKCRLNDGGRWYVV